MYQKHATGDLYKRQLSEYCMPFVKVGGYFIPYKSGEIDEELNQAKKAIGILGGKLKSVEKFVLPGTDAVSYTHLDVYKRQGVTPLQKAVMIQFRRD